MAVGFVTCSFTTCEMPGAPPRQHHGDPTALPPRSPPHPCTTPGPPQQLPCSEERARAAISWMVSARRDLGSISTVSSTLTCGDRHGVTAPCVPSANSPGGAEHPHHGYIPPPAVCASRVSAHTCCAHLHPYTHTAQRLSVHELARVPAHITTYVHKHTPCTPVPAHTPRHSLQPGPPCTHRTLVCSPCTLLVHKHCTHTLCTHKRALTVHACSYTRVHAKWCSRWCPPAHTHTHTLVQGRLCQAPRCPPCRGAPLRVPASHRRAHGRGEAMRDLEARNKLNCHGNAAPWTDFSQDTARLGADVRAAPAPAARWQGQAGQAGSGAPCTQWGRAPRHGSARLSGTSRKSWLSKEAWRSRRGSGAGRAARSGDSAFTSFHSTHRVVSTATAGRTGAASAPPSLAGWRLRAGSLGQPSLAPHETGHNSWQGSFLPPAALRCG